MRPSYFGSESFSWPRQNPWLQLQYLSIKNAVVSTPLSWPVKTEEDYAYNWVLSGVVNRHTMSDCTPYCRKFNHGLYSFSRQILSMITDRRVFEDIYLPRELIHRESEVGQLSRAFQPALSGSAPYNALISGPSGVGKLYSRATHSIVSKSARPSRARPHP